MFRRFVMALMVCLAGAVPVTIDGAPYRQMRPILQQRVASTAATKGWGVSVSAYGGGPAGGVGPALYVICNKSVTVYPDLTPPTYCLGSGAVPDAGSVDQRIRQRKLRRSSEPVLLPDWKVRRR